MAIDQALFEGVRAGAPPVLRLYRWRPACLSFGRNQPAAGLYDAERAHCLGIDIVRRPTGGLAVYHDHELTYAVAVATGPLGGPRATYAAIHRAIASGLVRTGVPAAVHSPAPAPVPGSAGATGRAAPLAASPCFHEPVAGEVVAGGRKLVGSAQRCENRTILQHGSILIDGDQSVAARLRDAATPAPASAGIIDFLGREPDAEALCDAVVLGFESECGIRFERDDMSGWERDRSRELVHQYRSETWTWRR